MTAAPNNRLRLTSSTRNAGSASAVVSCPSSMAEATQPALATDALESAISATSIRGTRWKGREATEDSMHAPMSDLNAPALESAIGPLFPSGRFHEAGMSAVWLVRALGSMPFPVLRVG